MSNMMLWRSVHPRAHINLLGFLPQFVSTDDPRPAREQFDANYVGGWCPMEGFSLDGDLLCYDPKDPPLKPLFFTRLRDEDIIVYENAWVVIRQQDGSWEVARMD